MGKPKASSGSGSAPAYAKDDISASRSEYLFPIPWPLDQLLLPTLNDARDSPMLHLLFNISATTVPAACLMYKSCNSHWVGLAYLIANYVLYVQRFMLTLHFTEHRRLFKSKYGLLNQLVPYMLCALYGVPVGVYRLHHCVMHHVEDNHAPFDTTSTEPFQRDSLCHFSWYWFRHAVLAWVELPLYAWRKGRYALAAGGLASEIAYWSVIAALWRVNHVATLWTLIVPYLVTSLAAMFGNWGQHVFIAPDGKGSAYTSAYNCVSCDDNRRTYNDGYHIQHHLNSRCHWSELPHAFLASLDQHDANDALVFHSIGFFDVGIAVFTGRLDFLARHIVPCGPLQEKRSQAEWVQLLKGRLLPIKGRKCFSSAPQQQIVAEQSERVKRVLLT